MIKNKLGPNGAITTCLNLYALEFSDIVKAVESEEDTSFLFDLGHSYLTHLVRLKFSHGLLLES